MKYLNQYFDSLEKQTSNDFDLLIGNDGLENIEEYIPERDYFISILNVNNSISSNRKLLINRAIDSGYQKLIFTDIDDMFECNRIELLNDILDHEQIVVNDLDIIDANGTVYVEKYFSNRFQNSLTIDIKTLLHGNIMGLSNTAVRAKILQGSHGLKAGDSIAYDWYFWSTVLFSGNEAYFTTETVTKYRNHGDNIAGLPQAINKKNILKGINVKKQHYELMSRVDCRYSTLAEEFQNLNVIVENKDFYTSYMEALKDHEIDYPMWWENIRTPTEVDIK